MIKEKEFKKVKKIIEKKLEKDYYKDTPVMNTYRVVPDYIKWDMVDIFTIKLIRKMMLKGIVFTPGKRPLDISSAVQNVSRYLRGELV